MKIEVLWIGKTRLAGVAALTDEYSRRLGRYCDFHGASIRAGGRKGGKASEQEVLLARSAGSYRVVLDPAGKRLSSAEFAGWLGRLRDEGRRRLCFCVGGAEGFPKQFRQSADLLLSISSLTLPHELARVVLLEQIYRAFTTLANHPYPR